MIKSIKNYSTNNSTRKYRNGTNISFKVLNPLRTEKILTDTYELLKYKPSIEAYGKLSINKVKNIYAFIVKIGNKKNSMPIVQKPLIAAMDTVDSLYAREIKNLAYDAKKYGLDDFYNRALNAATNAELATTKTTGGWSCNQLNEVKNKISDLKNEIQKAKSSGRHYFEDSTSLSFGKHVVTEDCFNTISPQLEDVTEMVQNIQVHTVDTEHLSIAGQDALHSNINERIADIPEFNLKDFKEIPSLEEMSSFAEIKELLKDTFVEMGDTLGEIWNVIKEEFLG